MNTNGFNEVIYFSVSTIGCGTKELCGVDNKKLSSGPLRPNFQEGGGLDLNSRVQRPRNVHKPNLLWGESGFTVAGGTLRNQRWSTRGRVRGRRRRRRRRRREKDWRWGERKRREGWDTAIISYPAAVRGIYMYFTVCTVYIQYVCVSWIALSVYYTTCMCPFLPPPFLLLFLSLSSPSLPPSPSLLPSFPPFFVVDVMVVCGSTKFWLEMT